MAFTFNFNILDEVSNPTSERTSTTGDTVAGDAGGDRVKAADEVTIDWDQLRNTVKSSKRVRVSDDLDLRVVDSEAVEKAVTSDPVTSDLSRAIQAQSDLLPHVYEGGLKIWECSVDLAQYMSTLQIAFRGTRVLELGCGAGLPGLVALSRGAHVTFQDYNSEVLKLITAPNVALNDCSDSRTTERCRVVAGDWATVQQLLETETKYDYIVTSETIYSRDSYHKLHSIMAALLKPGGTVYLAAKTYYFGVGGGTREFEALVEREGVFDREICQEYTTGVQREIWKLSFK